MCFFEKLRPPPAVIAVITSLFAAGLAVGLGIGAIAEVAKKSFKPKQQGDKKRTIVSLVDERAGND